VVSRTFLDNLKIFLTRIFTNLEPEKIISVIVFVGDATFKTPMPENVNYPRGYIGYIKSKKEVLLSDFEVKEAIRIIELGRFERTYKTHREHVKHVKDIVQKKESEKACPMCGSAMILRTVKKGANAGNKFWGCSKFPKFVNIRVKKIFRLSKKVRDTTKIV